MVSALLQSSGHRGHWTSLTRTLVKLSARCPTNRTIPMEQSRTAINAIDLGEFDMLSIYLRSIALRRAIGAVACVALISACGGGGSNSSAPSPAASYTVGGMVTGLSTGSLVLLDNGADALTVSSSGAFTFKTALSSGAAYAVTIATQPNGASCTVSMGTGTIANANITNV